MQGAVLPSWVTIITAIATTIAAIFAAFAAWRSADSARAAQEEGRASERRLLRRQLNVNAEEVRVETDRIKERASRLKLAHRGLAIFHGASGGSREKLYLETIDRKIAESETLAAQTAEVAAKPAEDATLDEISSCEAQVAPNLARVRALREEIEGKLTAAEAEIVQHRQSRLGPSDAQ